MHSIDRHVKKDNFMMEVTMENLVDYINGNKDEFIITIDIAEEIEEGKENAR